LSVLRKDNGADKRLVCGKIACLESDDWKRLLKAALKYRLFPAFYERLMSMKPDNLPQDFLSELRGIFAFNLKRNVLLERESFETIRCLQDSGIKAMPLKGPIMARYLHGDPALRRTSSDIDLLVKPENAEKAIGVLRSAGWAFAERTEGGLSYKDTLKYVGQVSLTKQTRNPLGNLCLDLHRMIFDPFMFPDQAGLWQGLRELDIDGNKAAIPSDEKLFIYFSLLSMSLDASYIYDLSVIISRYGDTLDWERIACSRDYLRSRTAVYFAVKLACELFGCEAPEAFLKKIKPGPAKETFLKIWINRKAVMESSVKWMHRSRFSGRIWYFFILSFLYSKDFFDCLRMICRRIYFRGEKFAVSCN